MGSLSASEVQEELGPEVRKLGWGAGEPAREGIGELAAEEG